MGFTHPVVRLDLLQVISGNRSDRPSDEVRQRNGSLVIATLDEPMMILTGKEKLQRELAPALAESFDFDGVS